MTKEEFRHIRQSYGYSRIDFAKELGYSYSSLNQAENGVGRSLSSNLINRVNAFTKTHVIEFDLRQSSLGVPELYIKKIHTLNTPAPDKIDSSELARDLMLAIFPDLPYLAEERVYMIGIDVKCNLIGISEIAHGGRAICLVDTAQVITRALLMGAYGIILVHNHPSKDTAPSDADTAITRIIKNGIKNIRIEFSDHIIIGGDRYYSFDTETDILED